mmetsp:Transcript_6824/g.11336  ORF Transcript_6824/g.11336 Transcript_6824/m.11336 type:complete len:1305 (+) Transcript_6824:255-4169(+)
MGGGASKAPTSPKTPTKRGYSQEVDDSGDHVKVKRKESSFTDEESKPVSGGVNMQQLAFGDSTPSWGDQHREYDSTLKVKKKVKPAELDWKECHESAASAKPRDAPRVIAPPKQPPPQSPHGSAQGSKLIRPSPTPKLKPAPPSVSPYTSKNNSRFSTPSNTPVRKLPSQGSGRSNTPQQSSVKKNERTPNLRVKTSSGDMTADSKVSSHQENVINILKKAKKYDDDSDESDSDCYDEEEEGDDSVYDWTTSNTNTSNCVTKVGADTRVDTASSIVRPPGQGKPPPSMLHQGSRSSSDIGDDMIADFGSDESVDTFNRPNNVPKLKIPTSAMSATPPQGPHKAGMKPTPPKGMPSNMNMKVGIPTPMNGPKSKMTPTPVRKQQPIHQPSPPNTRGASQGGKRHEVKETRDVKRNRAQLPSALKHVKPTTGDWLKKRYIVNNYIMLDVLGTGSYGEVRMCKERTTDELFGIKILSKEMLKKKKGGNTTETYFEDIKREIAIMKKLEHPNVLRLFEVLDDPNVNKLYLVLEYMKNGDLLHFIKERENKEDKDNKDKEKSTKRKNSKTFTPLSDQELWFIFKQVIAGVRYLHYQNIVHGDIKPQNILVSEDGTVKLADFGISKMLENGSNQKLVNAAGTPAFMSPELCEAADAFSGQLADVWAIGATMYMLRFGAPPFVSGNIMALYNKIINDPLEFPAGSLDPGLRNLLVNMLEKDPKRRYSTDQVTSHPWMRIPPSVNDSRKNVYTSASSTKMPPKSIHFNEEYVKKEAKAMKGPLQKVGDDDVFTSIGFGTIKKDEEVDDDEDELLGDDIMTSDWGLDVFEKVDAEDSDSAADSDDCDDDSSVDSPKRPQKPKIASKLTAQEPVVVTPTPKIETPKKTAPSHSAMDDKELDFRSKRFMSKLTKKSSNKYKTVSSSEDDDDEDYGDDDLMCDDEEPAPRKKSKGKLVGGEEDSAESMSMDDFEKMMDTLAMRPVSKSNLLSSGESTPHQAPLRPRDIEVPSEYTNHLNGVGGVYHSEQGCRKGQEDRCFFLISPGMYNKSSVKHSEFSTYINVENLSVSMEQKEHLHAMSIAGVFDGHSGSKCAQYLLEKFAPALVSKESLYNKSKQKEALIDTCREMDEQVCEYLYERNDSSGSTGVVMLYDGRSRVFTVANVGDSMCVLSRGGKAVKIHRTHRVGDEAEEVARVKAAGGTVVNKRVNGLLAISRAFGDTQFKSQDDISGPVIAAPDVVSEIITPMTEFAIAATDGLWDVIEPQVAVNFVKRRMLRKQDFATIVQDLVNDALDRGSVDNVTAVIIMFHLDKKDS